MKIPREILLQKHEAATPQLDQVWSEVASVAFDNNAVPIARPFLVNAWHELFWSYRRSWSGFAAVWAVVLLFNMGRKTPESTMAAISPSEMSQVMAMRMDQLQMLAELGRPVPESAPKAPPPMPAARDPKASNEHGHDNQIFV